MATKIKFNSPGVEAVLKSSEMHREINALAEKVADNVREARGR